MPSEHPYEVPGVSARLIIDGNPDYLNWIEEQTATGIDRTHQQGTRLRCAASAATTEALGQTGPHPPMHL